MSNIIYASVIAGIIGTGLGGLVIAALGSLRDKTISSLLSFAGGVMISIVVFELIPEAEALSNLAVTIIGIFIGMLMVLILNSVVDKVSNIEHRISMPHQSIEEYYHRDQILSRKRSLFRSGVLMLFVIALHNVPEGLVIGTAGNHDFSLGITLALMIGLHNIPEGMAIAAPLISSGMARGKTVGLTMLAGAPTVLGAMAGIVIGNVSDIAIALSFSVASGAMLYVVFGEIMPQSMNMSKSRIPTIVMLIGTVFGYLITKI